MICEEFKTFYVDREPAHAIEFQYEATSCDLWMTVKSGKYLLEGISILQALMLMTLNGKEKFTYAEIKQAFPKLSQQIPSHLIPLCKPGKSQVLLKNPATESFMPTDVFSLNADFASRNKKITLNTLHKRELKEDIDETREKVLNDRLYAIEGLIVRLLKGSKSMRHSSLVGEVLETLKLPLTSKDIAKCIDSLIVREYLQRDEDDPQIYHYIA